MNFIKHIPKTYDYEYYLVIDTETTGLDYTQDSIVEISWKLLDKDFTILYDEDFIIKVYQPILNSYIHKITNDISMERGIELHYVLDILKNQIQSKYDTKNMLMVGHNLIFDINFILQGCRNCFNTELLDSLVSLPKMCTMCLTTDICCIPCKYLNKHKFPKLQELYEFLFNKPFSGVYHNSKDDVIATVECLKELIHNNKNVSRIE